MARILVVEDSQTVISLVEQLLCSIGHKVHTARDGLTALAAVRALVPEIILLDIRLPHVDGFEVCSTLHRNPAYQSIPIVMMSGLSDQASIEKAHSVGAVGYLTKPFSNADLVEAVERNLASGCNTAEVFPGN